MGLTLDEIIERMAGDHSQHMSGGPSPEAELLQAEETLGLRLPQPFRAFLTRLGAGIYYQEHEIFGCRRVMIHDIELLPDLVSMRQRLDPPVAEGLFPLHRNRERLHLIDLSHGTGAGRVIAAGDAVEFPDLPAFLEAVVLPEPRA